MERLGIEYIDLINVHDIEFQAALPGGLQLVVDETLPALCELKAKGVVGHVGITDLQLQNLKWVIEHCEKGTVESILNFCHYTLNDDALEDYLVFFEQEVLSTRHHSAWDCCLSVVYLPGILLRNHWWRSVMRLLDTVHPRGILLRSWPCNIASAIHALHRRCSHRPIPTMCVVTLSGQTANPIGIWYVK